MTTTFLFSEIASGGSIIQNFINTNVIMIFNKLIMTFNDLKLNLFKVGSSVGLLLASIALASTTSSLSSTSTSGESSTWTSTRSSSSTTWPSTSSITSSTSTSISSSVSTSTS